MNKIIDNGLLDILLTGRGLMYVMPDRLPDGKRRPVFFTRDPIKGEVIDTTVSAYMLAKFGPSFEQAAKRLKEFLACDTCIMPNRHLVVVYPTGELGHFDENGKIVMTGDCYYDKAPARDCAADGNDIWLAVPGRNAVIKYALDDHKIVMRIGGGASTAFHEPVSVFCDKEQLYVCNRGSGEIRLVDTQTFNVTEYMSFKEPVNKYFRISGKEYIVLDSGVYEI